MPKQTQRKKAAKKAPRKKAHPKVQPTNQIEIALFRVRFFVDFDVRVNGASKSILSSQEFGIQAADWTGAVDVSPLLEQARQQIAQQLAGK